MATRHLHILKARRSGLQPGARSRPPKHPRGSPRTPGLDPNAIRISGALGGPVFHEQPSTPKTANGQMRYLCREGSRFVFGLNGRRVY